MGTIQPLGGLRARLLALVFELRGEAFVLAEELERNLLQTGGHILQFLALRSLVREQVQTVGTVVASLLCRDQICSL